MTFSPEPWIDAAVHQVDREWNPSPAPAWVTAAPQSTDERRVEDLNRRIATELGVDYLRVVERVRETRPRHELAHSYQKRWNVAGAFEVTGPVRSLRTRRAEQVVGRTAQISRWNAVSAIVGG